jgi:hypothetical protein
LSENCTKGHITGVIGRDKWGACRSCKNERAKIRYAKLSIEERRAMYNRPINRNRQWAKYGIKNSNGQPFTVLDYDRAYQIQIGRCKIPSCNRHQSELKRAFDVDHDHKTSIFRGLLCGDCNTDIGILEGRKYSDYKAYLNLEVK